MMSRRLQRDRTCPRVLRFTVAQLVVSFAGLSRAVALSRIIKKGDTSAAGFSTNAICRQRNCFNPVFPGYEDFLALEKIDWQCTDPGAARQHMNFCKGVVNYDVAVASPNKTSTELAALIGAQDLAASETYFYHLSGMKLDAWDFQKPWEEGNACVRAVWRMACNTYFPRAPAGCYGGEKTMYMRPCRNVCEFFTSACEVQCCDESVKCVFEREATKALGFSDMAALNADGNASKRTGYVDAEGPSAQCTGAAPASRALSTVVRVLCAALLLMLSSSTTSA